MDDPNAPPITSPQPVTFSDSLVPEDFIPRKFWGPRMPGYPPRCATPVPYVFVGYCRKNHYGHSKDSPGPVPDQDACCRQMAYILTGEYQQHLPDIRYNFMVCGGRPAEVYEGRGWSRQPTLPLKYQRLSGSAMFIGIIGDFTGKELQNKWKNLRTCFKKEYNAQTNLRSGSGANKKRRKYMYFDQMLFLLPTLENRATTSNLDSLDKETEDNTEIGNASNDAEEMLPDELLDPAPAKQPSKRCKQSKGTSSYEESLLKILKDKQEEDKNIDEDKYFLLSLLPTFKKFNDEQKFMAKTEIMNVIQRIRFNFPANQCFPNQQPFLQQQTNDPYNNHQMQQPGPSYMQNVTFSREVLSQNFPGNQQVSRHNNRNSNTANFFSLFNPSELGTNNNDSEARGLDESSGSTVYSLK